ncbi:MAG: LuxR C-terminal-related transcriptional regulator [Candidatus Competibacteraceae bacterium]
MKPPTPAPVSTPNTSGITERELQVLRLVAKAFSYGEIAGLLNLSVHTVTTHIKQIYRKLAVRSRGEAVYEALQLGLIQFDQ